MVYFMKLVCINMIFIHSIVFAGGVTTIPLDGDKKIKTSIASEENTSEPANDGLMAGALKGETGSALKTEGAATSGGTAGKTKSFGNAGGLEKVDSYGMLMGTSQTAGGFTKTLTNITTELNSVFVILRTLVFIIAICLIYLGLFQYAKANGGQGESEAKQKIKKAVLVILILASLSSVILLVYSIAQTLVFA